MSADNKVTALIPAFNAAQTIARAIDSVRNQVDQILVVDDGSRDATVAVVQEMNIPHLKLTSATENKGIGAARQQLLDLCDTEVAVWLDADDEFLSGRVERLKVLIDQGADWVFDAAELVDGITGQYLRELPIPNFLQQPGGLIWELARNFIPSIGWGMVRTSAAKAIGYDATFTQAEDYDHLLRAIVAGGNIHFCPQIGYRHYHYPTTASRNLSRQIAFSEQALKRIDRKRIHTLIDQSDLNKSDRQRVFAWYLARVRDWPALQSITETSKHRHWELSFFLGVSCYYQNQLTAAEAAFRDSLQIKANAGSYNNLGVCQLEQGMDVGRESIYGALSIMPHYLDARRNLEGVNLVLTDFPLREQPSRDMYL